MQADATYLIVNDQGELENFGLNAVCTHLGCVVPWDTVRGSPGLATPICSPFRDDRCPPCLLGLQAHALHELC